MISIASTIVMLAIAVLIFALPYSIARRKMAPHWPSPKKPDDTEAV